MNKTKNIIGKLHLEKLAYLLKDTKKYFKYQQDLKEFHQELPQFISSHNNKTTKTLIVSLISGFFSAGVKEEALIAKSLEIDGADIYVLLERGSLAEGFYQALGINKFIYLDDFYFKFHESRHFDYTDFNELLNIQYQGIQIGKHVVAVYMRRQHSGYFELNETTKIGLEKLLSDSVAYVDAITAIDQHYGFSKALFLERGYSPNGEIFDYLISKNVDCIQWCGSHKENAITLKRYHKNNSDKHPASISKKTWEWAKANINITDQVEKSVVDELYRNYHDGTWFSEVGTQFNTKIETKEKVLKRLDCTSSKPIAIIFSHLFWDATFFWGEDLFQDYKEWFIETIKEACKNDNIQWFIKVHPSNLVKLKRDGYTGELAEILAIKEKIGELPEHIKIIYPDTEISTFSLFDIMDYCLTVRGTIGIECSAFGITTLTAGTGRYDSLGFTNDSATKEEYLAKIANLHNLDRMVQAQQQLALLYAYITLILRPFNLSTFTIEYLKNNNATAIVKINSKSAHLLHNTDLKSLAHWAMKETTEDYLCVE